jgi:hypothetical protein
MARSAQFVNASALASANFSGSSFSLGAFTITGQRWTVSLNAVIISATGAPNTFFPGNANGNAATGGQGV